MSYMDSLNNWPLLPEHLHSLDNAKIQRLDQVRRDYRSAPAHTRLAVDEHSSGLCHVRDGIYHGALGRVVEGQGRAYGVERALTFLQGVLNPRNTRRQVCEDVRIGRVVDLQRVDGKFFVERQPGPQQGQDVRLPVSTAILRDAGVIREG